MFNADGTNRIIESFELVAPYRFKSGCQALVVFEVNQFAWLLRYFFRLIFAADAVFKLSGSILSPVMSEFRDSLRP
jgi:hypothetical protein